MPIEAVMDTEYLRSVFVWLRSGRKLQPIRSPLRLDHSPVGVFVATNTCVRYPQEKNGIDRNALMRCVLKGEKREELFKNVRDECMKMEEIHAIAKNTNLPQ